jgi:Putative threonine/serine exporter
MWSPMPAPVGPTRRPPGSASGRSAPGHRCSGHSPRVVGNLLAAAGLAVLLGGAWSDVGVAAVLGGVVGMLLLVDLPQRFQVLVVLAAAFVVALGVFLLARAGLSEVILPALLAPLVTLLPGVALTTGVVELATGQMISGAGRIAAGGMQLVLQSRSGSTGQGRRCPSRPPTVMRSRWPSSPRRSPSSREQLC